MTISLTKDQEALIEKQLASGRYNSRAEVIRDALELLNDYAELEEAKLARLRNEIQKGIESGEATPLDMEEVKAAAREQRSKQAR
jgi:antitoxin ParD1/3/4